MAPHMFLSGQSRGPSESLDPTYLALTGMWPVAGELAGRNLLKRGEQENSLIQGEGQVCMTSRGSSCGPKTLKSPGNSPQPQNATPSWIPSESTMATTSSKISPHLPCKVCADPRMLMEVNSFSLQSRLDRLGKGCGFWGVNSTYRVEG